MPGRRKNTERGLDHRARALLELAGTAAIGSPDALRARYEAARRAGASDGAVRDLLALCSAFCGWPTCLSAFGELPELARRRSAPPPPRRNAARKAGLATLRAVYGGNLPAILARIRSFDPALCRLVIEVPYGELYQRRGLSLPLKELAACVLLAIQGRKRELHGHLKGALRVGVSREQLRQAIAISRHLIADAVAIAPERADHALALLERIRG
ncbi:MAG: carboxymuconolactone decarboxylase family protein [Acidobacteriota bacterium]